MFLTILTLTIKSVSISIRTAISWGNLFLNSSKSKRQTQRKYTRLPKLSDSSGQIARNTDRKIFSSIIIQMKKLYKSV